MGCAVLIEGGGDDVKGYLKIGMYQSVLPVPLPPDDNCDLGFPGISMKFHFVDSGECEEDGMSIWVAKSVETRWAATL